MAGTLTLRDTDLLLDAIFEKAGNAATPREEDRWLSLEQKISRIRQGIAQAPCVYGHARDKHRYRTGITSRCRICHCETFTRQNHPTKGTP